MTDLSGAVDGCPSAVGDLWKGASNLDALSGYNSNASTMMNEATEIPLTAVESGSSLKSKTTIEKRLQEVRPSVSSLHCLSFHDIHYEVTQRKCFKKQPNKIILNSISGLMLPGLNAIMGPTGSGKTSLLDVLADRKSKTALSGTVLLNGSKRPPNFKTMVGYVVQDDVVMGTLSIRENLHFSAALRLPSKMTHKERKDRVDKVVQELGLEKVENSKIGTEFIRGVSGGERKRTNIGMELIIEPQVLFLDEPTTGLDANTAVLVVQILKDLSQVKNRIVVMSIHQPRYSIYKLFDTLTLLSVGNVVYHGNAHKALEYFDRIGFRCEEHENPADYFLDIVNHDEQEQKDNVEFANCRSDDATNLASKYHKSAEHQELHNVIDPILANYKAEKDVVRDYRLWNHWCHKYETSFFWQTLVVMARSFINLLRNPGTSILQVFTLTFFAVVIGGIYWQLGTGFLGFQDRIGVFFFIAINQAFGSLSAIELFIKQRSLFIHEAASGYYGVMPFFIAKVCVDILIFRLIPNILFTVVTYFMIGLQLSASRFFIYFLLIVMTNISAVSIAFGISAGTRVVGIANLFIAVIFVVSMLFGGLLIALESLPPWIQWLKYFSFIRYGIEGMAINEMDGLTFDCSQDQLRLLTGEGALDANCSMPVETNCTFDGLQRLITLGYQVNWLWYDLLALVVFSLVFLTIAYVVLALVKKEK